MTEYYLEPSLALKENKKSMSDKMSVHLLEAYMCGFFNKEIVFLGAKEVKIII